MTTGLTNEEHNLVVLVLVHGIDSLKVPRQPDEHSIDLDRWSVLDVVFEDSPQVAILEDEQFVPDDGDGIVAGVAWLGGRWQRWSRDRTMRVMVLMMVVMYLGWSWNVRRAFRVRFPRIGLFLVRAMRGSDSLGIVRIVDAAPWDLRCGACGSFRVRRVFAI